MGISPYPTSVVMPRGEKPYPSILEFLCRRFSKVEPASWERRIAEGKVLDEEGRPVGRSDPYRPDGRIFYFKEVAGEAVIPFREKILFQNDEILICCKPHFLPVTAAGRFVEECLVNRLRKSTGNHDIVPLHRIDRETAGLVLFSTRKANRALYSALFKEGRVQKRYHALAALTGDPEPGPWRVENRIISGEPWFRMKVAPGPVNARSLISLAGRREGLARFELTPVTGKTHQLRIHLSGLGFGILNDRLYPELRAETPDDFAKPLQLLAKSLKFQDPLTGNLLEFESDRELLW